MFDESTHEKIRPKHVDEVDYEAFDVRSVWILISHDHDATIAKRFKRLCGRVVFIVAQPHYLDDVFYFRIFHNLNKLQQKSTTCIIILFVHFTLPQFVVLYFECLSYGKKVHAPGRGMLFGRSAVYRATDTHHIGRAQ